MQGLSYRNQHSKSLCSNKLSSWDKSLKNSLRDRKILLLSTADSTTLSSLLNFRTYDTLTLSSTIAGICRRIKGSWIYRLTKEPFQIQGS